MRPKIKSCLNCGTILVGRYCSTCGQDASIEILTIKKLWNEYVEKLFGLEARLPKTLRMLFFKPGQMTIEYLSGFRQRYVSPLRTYLAVSVLFFLMLRLVPAVEVKVQKFGIEINTLSSPDSRLNSNSGFRFIDESVQRFSQQPQAIQNQAIMNKFLSHSTQAMFLLVPLFALATRKLFRLRPFWSFI